LDLYGGADLAKGFDCSGFITYVFKHFNIEVPRSSNEFEHIGIKRSLNTCRPGDVIMFSGTDPQEYSIGHIGIVCDITNGNPSFIHSTSGKADGVAITSMDNKFYKDRYISVIDLLFQNNE
jgi:lipoprotein Spr